MIVVRMGFHIHVESRVPLIRACNPATASTDSMHARRACTQAQIQMAAEPLANSVAQDKIAIIAA